MTGGPFEGIKVVDFTWASTGPIITKYLADYGATVVRIESTRRPDNLRSSPPYWEKKPGINRGGFFLMWHANKHSVTLDLTHPEGVAVAKRLVAWADVVAENFVPGVLEKWGLGYEELKAIKPGIIVMRSCNQGQTGPYARVPGLGLQLVGLAGFTHLTGWPDRIPQQPGGAYTDHLVPFFGVATLAAALDYRRRTGKGQCLDLSQYEAAIHFLAPVALDYTVNGREAKRAGNSCPDAAPHEVFRCKGDDRWCAITVSTDEEWDAFCRVIGTPAWTRDPKFATMQGRKKNENELDRLVEEWTLNSTAEEVMTALQAAGVPAGVVANGRDVFDEPQLKHRGHYWMLNHSEIGPVSHLSQFAKLSKTSAEPRMPAPCLGEHTEFVCREFLGMSDEEFTELFTAGVFE